MKSTQKGTFNAQTFLDSSGIARKIVEYRRAEVIYNQGDPCEHVLYLQRGGVKLSVLSKTGREAVVAMLGPGEFFGEGCLAGQPIRMGSATTTTDSSVLFVDKNQMVRLLHKQHALSDRFIAHMLARNIRIEEDLVDQLFNSSEKRLARTLLLLARYGKHDKPVRTIPRISQETMAEMVGTTRSRVNFFMKKFQRLGFIDYADGLKVNSSLLAFWNRADVSSSLLHPATLQGGLSVPCSALVPGAVVKLTAIPETGTNITETFSADEMALLGPRHGVGVPPAEELFISGRYFLAFRIRIIENSSVDLTTASCKGHRFATTRGSAPNAAISLAKSDNGSILIGVTGSGDTQ